MKQNKFAKAAGYCLLLSLQLVTVDAVRAQENFRIGRPAAGTPTIKTTYGAPAQSGNEPIRSQENSTSTLPADANAESKPSTTLKANAIINLEDQPNPPDQNAIFDWQNKYLPANLQDRYGATAGSDNNGHHRGLKAHLGGAFSILGTVVGSVASSYIPVASVALRNRPSSEPKIAIEAGHCPAAFDPAFQVPVRWWDILSSEEANPGLGPQWKFWLIAVQNVFQAHARELRETPGVASLHVIVNPNGSIYDVSPYTGAERGNQGHAISERTMINLRQILLTVGRFPPFPEGSKVRCYHLIFDGSSGI